MAWINWIDPQKQQFPEEHGKNDARDGKEAITHKVDMMDRIFGAADEVRDAERRYQESYNEEKQTVRDEQNNEYLRQIAENTKPR